MIADKQVEYIDFGFDQSVQSLNKLARQPCSETDQQPKSEIHSLDDEDKFKGIGSFPNRNKRKLSTACIR